MCIHPAWLRSHQGRGVDRNHLRACAFQNCYILTKTSSQCHQRSVQGGGYLLYLHSFAFKYRYILTGRSGLMLSNLVHGTAKGTSCATLHHMTRASAHSTHAAAQNEGAVSKTFVPPSTLECPLAELAQNGPSIQPKARQAIPTTSTLLP
jgi:hypothetical protein